MPISNEKKKHHYKSSSERFELCVALLCLSLLVCLFSSLIHEFMYLLFRDSSVSVHLRDDQYLSYCILLMLYICLCRSCYDCRCCCFAFAVELNDWLLLIHLEKLKQTKKHLTHSNHYSLKNHIFVAYFVLIWSSLCAAWYNQNAMKWKQATRGMKCIPATSKLFMII